MCGSRINPGMTLDDYMTRESIGDAAMAARLGCDRSRVNRLRRGAGRPSLALAARIERVTNGAVPASAWALETAS